MAHEVLIEGGKHNLGRRGPDYWTHGPPCWPRACQAEGFSSARRHHWRLDDFRRRRPQARRSPRSLRSQADAVPPRLLGNSLTETAGPRRTRSTARRPRCRARGCAGRRR
eukprot:scaffold85900_cov36-Prasinocladus_malaysianus.AAC.1